MKQAVADAAGSGADISVVVMDRNTGQIVSGGNGRPFPIASVVKLFIADELLLEVSRGQTQLSPADRKSLDVMLRSSDDSAAQIFWDRLGGSAVIGRVAARYGLQGTTAPFNGKWDLTLSTASDLVRYYDLLLDGGGGLPPEQANVIMTNLANPRRPESMATRSASAFPRVCSPSRWPSNRAGSAAGTAATSCTCQPA